MEAREFSCRFQVPTITFDARSKFDPRFARFRGGRLIRICPYINVAPNLPIVNMQINPFATLVPKCQYSDRSFATLVPKLPNVNIQIDPFATLVPKCQYSDRIHSQSGWLGQYLAGAAIRTRNHNYEDRNYDLNAHPHI